MVLTISPHESVREVDERPRQLRQIQMGSRAWPNSGITRSGRSRMGLNLLPPAGGVCGRLRKDSLVYPMLGHTALWEGFPSDPGWDWGGGMTPLGMTLVWGDDGPHIGAGTQSPLSSLSLDLKIITVLLGKLNAWVVLGQLIVCDQETDAEQLWRRWTMSRWIRSFEGGGVDRWVCPFDRGDSAL